MYLDIVLGVLLLVFIGLGFSRGFLCGILGFVANIISVAAAIFLAKPTADFTDKVFDWSNNFDNIMDNLGRPLNILICCVAIFIACRLVFWILARFIRSIKEQNRVVDTIDKVAGLLLGAAKLALLLFIVFTVVSLLDVIPFVEKSVDWVFDGSIVGKFLYEDVFLKFDWLDRVLEAMNIFD